MPRTLRARRPHPPIVAGHQHANRRDRGRPARRGPRAGRLRVVAGSPGRTHRDRARARRRTPTRDLGSPQRPGRRVAPGPRRPGRASRLVAGRICARARATGRRPSPPAPAQPRHLRAGGAPDRGGLDHRRPRASRRLGVVPAPGRGAPRPAARTGAPRNPPPNTPSGAPPSPPVMLVHGGPTWLDLDRWAPDVQAHADAGFLVAMVNYRGSIGYGRQWRDTLIGNIGFPESEDVLAGHDDLLRRGLADPARSVIAGWSWGGYITLLMHGLHPDRFVAGIAGVPVGDYAASYEDLSPTLQAYDRALLGGTPAELPELMRERSPISYVDQVDAPLLILVHVA